jgi:hypothetical protein
MNHVKTSFSTEIYAGAIISVVQYVAPLRYTLSLVFSLLCNTLSPSYVVSSILWWHACLVCIEYAQSESTSLLLIP